MAVGTVKKSIVALSRTWLLTRVFHSQFRAISKHSPNADQSSFNKTQGRPPNLKELTQMSVRLVRSAASRKSFGDNEFKVFGRHTSSLGVELSVPPGLDIVLRYGNWRSN